MKGPFRVEIRAVNDESDWRYVGMAEDVEISQNSDYWYLWPKTLKDINLNKSLSFSCTVNPVTYAVMTGISEEEAREAFEKGLVHCAVPPKPVPTIDLLGALSG